MDVLFANFKWGRTDCATAPTTEVMHTFPKAHDGLEATLTSMSDILGISTRETVALLGAHTLGAANPDNSGFAGPWVTNPLLLDNDYYKVLLIGWRATELPNGNHQWTRADRTMMLNSDMCLAKKISPDADGAPAAGCNPQVTGRACPDAETKEIVVEFANDNEKWLKEFAAVMQKMAANCPKDSTGACVWNLKDVEEDRDTEYTEIEMENFIDTIVESNF